MPPPATSAYRRSLTGGTVAGGEPGRARHAPATAMLMRMPAAAMVMTRDEPPKEMKGRGMPVTGSRPMTAPMLITAWLVIQVVMPTAIRLPNRSGARVAARSPNQARAKNNESSTTAPDQSQLFPHHREDEVGVGVGQRAPLLATTPEAQAE